MTFVGVGGWPPAGSGSRCSTAQLRGRVAVSAKGCVSTDGGRRLHGGAGGNAAGVGLQDAALAAGLAQLSQLSVGRVGFVELLTWSRRWQYRRFRVLKALD